MPSETFGRYQLEELLAVGGMGEVFVATDRGSPGADPAYRRICVVKRILPQLRDQPDIAAMFAREATLGALLSHHSITQVLDHGAVDGRPYLALEYVRGCNLKSLLDAHRSTQTQLGISDVTHILTHVAMALDHAHRAMAPDGSPLGLVHRDVSPQNVLLSVDGEVKLTDFGMARGNPIRGVFQTQETMLKGKMAYLSPEQASGSPVDARSDVFALGVLLFEMTTLQHPFTHDGVAGVALLDRIRRASFPSPQGIRADLPEWITGLIQRCLVAEPNDRMPSARAVLDVIREGAPIHLAQGSLAGVVRRVMQRSDAPGTRESAAPVVSAPRTQEAAAPLRARSTEEAWHDTPPRIDDDLPEVRNRLPVLAGGFIAATILATAIVWLTGGTEPPPAPPSQTAFVDGGAAPRPPIQKPAEKKKAPRPRPREVLNPDALMDALPRDVDASVPSDGG